MNLYTGTFDSQVAYIWNKLRLDQIDHSYDENMV